ncbi:hypothetical protein Trydic_g21318 [Trypoxylus dichotomus]
MLEGAVARLLNQLLGKYVVDLDTENLNVGIFSGQVQLTDLKLKPEALFELNLPIEVKAGTIGKIWLKIPWNMLWTQPVVVNIEDLHVVASPVVNYDKFDAEKNKRLLRAIKRKALNDISAKTEIIGGPTSFSEYLITTIVNNMQLNINNVHIRYEDGVSDQTSVGCGICIGHITAELTNSKWKASRHLRISDTCYYLVKIEAFSIYWNPNHTLAEWKLPSQYYHWRNAMTNSLKNFSINNEAFEFLIKPMAAKIKMTINRNADGDIGKVLSDVVVQDCNIQISKEQFRSMFCIVDALKRMWIAWEHLSIRPKERVLENSRVWWRYAYLACTEQRIRPYTWSRIRLVRRNYKKYTEIYKKILTNPNDTELKLDLQKYEDQLSIVNIVIARQQARLTVNETSLCEKSFWDILPSPERTVLCEKIGFVQPEDNEKISIDHNYSFRVGNTTLSLTDSGHEVLIVTLTQLISNLHPNYSDGTYKAGLKVEAVMVEGSSVEEQLIPIISSEHLTVHNSPAYFLKLEFEQMPAGSQFSYKLNLVLEYLEISYHRYAFDELRKFLIGCEDYLSKYTDSLHELPKKTFDFLREKLMARWDITLDVRTPYFVIPQSASLQTGENILILDLGRYRVSTDLCQESQITENSTHMELEEQLYSRFRIEGSDIQVLFCDSSEDWRSGRKERDTELHMLAKNSFSATYANCVKSMTSIPKQKFNVTMQSFKINISERKLLTFLKFLNSIKAESEDSKPKLHRVAWPKDRVVIHWNPKYLSHIQDYITLQTFVLTRRKNNKSKPAVPEKKSNVIYLQKENDVWARCVDLPGLEDNISPSNTISSLIGCEIKEFQLVFSKSSDSADRQYMILRLGMLAIDIAYMTFGPAFQISLNSILLKDKLHTTPSGQYLDLVYSPVPCIGNVITVLYRKVSAGCPDFLTYFHGVETSLVAEIGAIYLLLHQEAVHTFIKYARYIQTKLENAISPVVAETFLTYFAKVRRSLETNLPEVPVPPGSVKFSHSARLASLRIRVCDWDYDIINILIGGLEVDFLFRANERFVFRSYLANINVEHLSDVTLYSKVLYTDEDKVFEVKYVRHAAHLIQKNEIAIATNDVTSNGNFKLYIGQIHVTFLYKLFIQLQRFVVNLEALCYIEKIANCIRKIVEQATDTLKLSPTIHLAVTIKGPVLLFPQKTSSPNVIIISTGEFTVENFFKEYTNEIVENILIKADAITVTRGIMSLTSVLESQEVIVEPVCMNLDVKRFSPSSKSTTRNQIWDIDGIMDIIQITLGQRDLSTILAIYSDNIGEGKLLDLLPVPIIKSPGEGKAESDDEVKKLEAFFCEPKQKYMNIRFGFEGIHFVLFFDSGELLSSPIRDLNHGLCRFEINEIGTSCVLFTDTSLDGKLSVDGLSIEEIGPDANKFDKRVLQSPIDDNRNNNCNITVNKPPIIDLTFHQSKANDRSIDIIIGRLTLSLSVPFTEKLAMFVLDCLPKDTLDTGFINHGYVSDPVADEATPKARMTSLTVAVRINRPEFIFIVEAKSNKKRYFTTKSEILSDYSRHCNRFSLMISLSGLHSLFYDVALHSSMEPYTILKQCDVELTSTYTAEKGEKVTASVSSIFIQLCNRVVYSINDVLNDIVEHFKVPEGDVTPARYKRNDMMCKDSEDLWEPKRLKEYICKDEYTEVKSNSPPVVREVFLLPKTDMIVVLELEEIPVIIIKATLEVTMCDWSHLLNSTSEFTLQVNYFNENNQCWEPILDPTVLDDYEYKAWEVNVRIFQDKALPMLSNSEAKSKKSGSKEKKSTSATSSEEEEESGDDMVYLQPTNAFHTRSSRNVKTNLSTFLDDSDSENEDVAMEKLAAAISDLFTGASSCSDWNESETSESEHSSDGEEDSDEEVKPKTNTREQPADYKKSTYVLVDVRDPLNITITPTFLKVLNDLVTLYSNKTLSISYSRRAISLINDIGPNTKVELFENRGSKAIENSHLMCSKTYEPLDSCPNSPSRNPYLITDYMDDYMDDRDSYTDEIGKGDIELELDLDSVNSLDFPLTTTPHLYEKINKHHLKIHVPGFQPIQTCCPKKTWRKLMKLQCNSSSKIYYLIANHSIGKQGRSVVVSSPLQVRNETCFALSILYQPSVLQQMNLEPVGDMTNPFETTMRIAVLEPHEQYNVPLYIAYHCKLFIQPAYAEGHYASDTGIWWQDLATELDAAHDFHCNPKSDSNLEVFSLRIVLKRNIDVKNSQSHFIPNYVIHLLPPLIFRNYLPYTVEVENLELNQMIKVESGEKASAYALNLSRDQKLCVRVIYSCSLWSGILNLTTHFDEKVMHLTNEDEKDDDNKYLTVNVKADREGSCYIYFYAPYWIVNKTGLPVHIKPSGTNNVLESVNGDILLFSYRRHGKQSLNMKVYESEWSNDFGIECAGTTGLIVCKDKVRRKKYAVLLSIHLSQMCPRFTKIVTFSPNFLIINNTNKTIRFMEQNEKTDLWTDLPPHQCTAFWPDTSSMQMCVKYRDSKLTSQAFFISSNHYTVLRMGKESALCVNVTGGRTDCFRVAFNDYKDGDAPVLVKNLCADLFLKIQQQGQGQATLVNPYHSLMYTWEDPTKPRLLLWNVYNNKGTGFNIDISKDGYGEERINFHSVTPNQNSLNTSSSDDSDSCDSVKTTLNKKVRRDKIVIYWICHREGLQKTLVFTQEQKVYNDILKTVFMENCDIEFLVSFAGVGISIFTNPNSTKEHIFASISDSPAIWEVNVGHKWKTLTLELASWIEDKYRLLNKKCQLKDYVHIDFEKMFMLKPFFAELRRNYNPAVLFQLRKSQNYQYFNLKLQSIQIDNKQPSSNDTVALNPIPGDAIKAVPVVEFSCFRTCSKGFEVYKHINLNVEDFCVNIASELLLSLGKLVTENRKWVAETATLFRNDLTLIRTPTTMIQKHNSNQNVLIETLNMSQMGIQVSISHKEQTIHNNKGYPVTKLLDYLFPVYLSPYMPTEGVRHKIAALEMIDLRRGFLSILGDMWEHFSTQFLQQYYSQVLGQHVLVNPYAIQAVPTVEKAPNEYEKISNIVLFGCKCYIGHINMSTASLGQCIVDIFVNQYVDTLQRIRRHSSYHKSSIVSKSITASSRNFNPGVVLALEQVILRNHSGGLQRDGEIFFRGTGKALHSLVTRHPDDGSNHVQVAIEALRRAAILGEPVKIHQRLTRYSNSHLGLKPFSVYDSMGHHLLETVANNRFKPDIYWAHAAIDRIAKSIIIISLEHIIRVNKCRFWGSWEMEWCLDMDDVESVPQVTSNELIFNVRQGEVDFLSSGGKLIVTGQKEMLVWLQEKIEQAMVVSMEEKSWAITEE